MTTSLLSGNNHSYLYQNQSFIQKLYSPLISSGIDYIYSTQIDKINSDNSRKLAMYSGISTFATSIIADTILLPLTTQNNLYIVNQSMTQKIMPSVLNAFIYLFLVRSMKSNLAYYNNSDFKTMLKAAGLYMVSDVASDWWISMQTA